MNIARIIIIVLFLGFVTICKASQNVIDSCELTFTSSVVFPSCKIMINKDSGYIERKKIDNLILPINKDICTLMINRLDEIFIEKRYPIIVSKKRAEECVVSEYPFLNVTIFFKGKKFDKMLYVAWRDESHIYNFSEGFAELWEIIKKLVYDFCTKQKSINNK